MPFVWKCVWDAFAAVLEPLLCGSKRKHFSLTENGPPTCRYANQGFKHSKGGKKKHLSPRVLRLKGSEGFVCQAFPFWWDEISEDSVSMCLNAYFLYCFIWIPREITFHPLSVYLLDSFHVCLNISLYIKFGRVPTCLQASVCACFPFFLVGTHTCLVCTEVCLAVQVVCLQPREVTFAISHAQPFCPRPLPSRTQPVGASARTASPLLYPPPDPGPSITRWPHRALI